jgi:CSLREA domain-containing protein
MRTRAVVLVTSLAVLALAGSAQIGAAVTITVGTTVDDFTVNGNCTLREAIRAANTDSRVDACPAGSGADTIVLPSGMYTITVANPGNVGEDAGLTGDYDITAPLTIQGQGSGGAGTMVSGDYLDRIFDVHATTASLSGMTLNSGGGASTQSQNGGDIRSDGALTVSDSVLLNGGQVGNGHIVDGGGIASSGALTLVRDTVYANAAHRGGGIFSIGPLKVTDSTFLDNGATGFGGGGGIFTSVSTGTAVSLTRVTMSLNTSYDYAGGAIHAAGPLSVSASTITNNAAGTSSHWFDGGGIQMDAGGGTVLPGALTLTASTVDHNRGLAGDGLNIGGGTAALTNDTIDENGLSTTGGDGGGLYAAAGSTVTLANDTFAENVANNGAGSGGNIYNAGAISAKNSLVVNADSNCSGIKPTSLGHNDDYSASSYYCFAGPTDISLDPQLGSLADNGGPTKTRALPAGSPAVDAGAGCATTDQRGFVRPQGSACDLGAYELLKFFALTVSKAGAGAGTVTSAPAGIDCGSACSASFAGTVVTLTANAASGSSFGGWSGACSGTSTCKVTLTAARAVTATFVVGAPPPLPPPPSRCVVPKLLHKTLAGAKKAIVKAHCRTGKITHAYSKRVRRGRIVAQSPKAGRRLPRGAKIKLVVSRGRHR